MSPIRSTPSQWDLRTAPIKDENGKRAVRAERLRGSRRPGRQLATNVVVSKYFYGENGTPERETSVRQLIHRVTRTIADWGIADGYFATRRRWRALLSRADLALPASARRVQLAGLVQRRPVPSVRRRRAPSATGAGTARRSDVEQPENPYEYPQGSACFIQSVDDNMEDIMRLATSEAMLFKFGSGTGTDLSTIRSAARKALRRRQALGPAVVHAGLRPDRRGREVAAARPAAPPRCSRSRSGIPTSSNSSSASGRKRRRPTA